MARDEARHGKAFEGLLKRYFDKQIPIQQKEGGESLSFLLFSWTQKRTPGSAGGRKKPMARGEVDKKKSPS